MPGVTVDDHELHFTRSGKAAPVASASPITPGARSPVVGWDST
jgi:hypothetical protein